MALDRQTVVRTALRVLDEVGLEGLTLRRIAAELDVRAPALYWHFKNKQELLDAMATTLLVDALDRFGVPDTGDWVELAEAYGRGLRAMLLSHRDGARMFSGTFLTDDTAYGSMERAIRTLTGAGFSARDAVRGLNTIYCFTIGFTIEEQAVHPRPGQRAEQYDLAARTERVDPALPHVRDTGAEVLDNFDDRFEHGLQVIISGLGSTLGRADP
ncbi:TetR/AcrR family transcriptional regulator C-terminal domain-containing protein [Actinophytocola sp.]|uniref:TetR/AcrR family transcriptional regulator C-terminal domain-containing protein n=1 Tax=Actinophytocola sp. TaxID=1872138 RepID=UPI002D7FF44F|nr:TetR/AcrR family transcriptional regulator C-terminal domain-containing protein [Actinophytocola sp.]HET9140485.1 TetR/AcrR family transcriptional regulator C-terminal domain-containing protein [Actinophytocola sp.]